MFNAVTSLSTIRSDFLNLVPFESGARSCEPESTIETHFVIHVLAHRLVPYFLLLRWTPSVGQRIDENKLTNIEPVPETQFTDW